MVVAGKYVRIIWKANLVTFSCIEILSGGLHELPINTEIPGMQISTSIFDFFLWKGVCINIP
jgi:hypothetical protein